MNRDAESGSLLVTAVIPTRNRPELVCQAVRSVLNQSYGNVEAVVVIDGEDSATVQALETLSDPRLRIVTLAQSVGGGEARNVGGREARGEWIALLDDDDEWLPEKIEKQMGAIAAADPETVFSATQYFRMRSGSRSIQPATFPLRQHISEYLFCEVNWRGRRTTFLQTSTWMIKRSFLLLHPFTIGLKRNQDTDWLLNSFPDCANEALFVSEPLSVFNDNADGKRISTTIDWKYNYLWARRNAQLFTPRALTYFIITMCAGLAAKQGHGFRSLSFLWRRTDARYRSSSSLLVSLGKCMLIVAVHPLVHLLSGKKELRSP